ncbi:MAG: transcriptional regulator [Bacteroidetes bacterium MedPE-SWsnd-G2]|nr:MAG: transcriptional regulator [Bacteroidetes bacterium MedPE-SWsnd-G2]
MKYPPQHHQCNDKQKLLTVIKHYPLATIISVDENGPLVTHLPLIVNDSHQLIGHIDKFNPHGNLLMDNNNVTVIFSGPQCYISPSIYTTTQLPTWNYIKVHLKGKVQAITEEEEIMQTMVDMTTFLEGTDQNYKLEMSNPRMAGAINYVKGFKIDVHSWEGKFKLSQDKKAIDKNNARSEMERAEGQSISSFLDKIY